MADLPIIRMTLYKHGVGFFERRAALQGEQVELSFRVEEMNDILKSLTAIDWGEGKVLGVEYATPQSREERLAGCSIRLADDRSLRDLLVGLRGRRVRLELDQSEVLSGVLLGPDEAPEREPLASTLVSLLADTTPRVQVAPLGRIQGIRILDERGVGDLRFFLQTALSQERFRQVTIRLTPGRHDLAVSYIAPAPTWRVSYRLVIDPPSAKGRKRQALLLGWGIFDNRLEEDLQGIALSLVAGMPISFVYDLYTPFTPERPEVKEEARVAAAPVEFAGAVLETALAPAPAFGPAMAAGRDLRAMAAAAPKQALSREALREAAPVAATGQALGELFQYTIATPVTVGRGQSAMVPIVSGNLRGDKALLYNGAKLPVHPVATLRVQNKTGLTLERGPVTVIEAGEYAGEAVLPFTVDGSEATVAYAVELGVKVREADGSERQMHALHVKGAYLQIEEWDVRWRDYQLNNSTAQPLAVQIEHARSAQFELADTPEPQERSDEHWRFEVAVPARGEATLRVRERRLVGRREELRQQSFAGLQRFLTGGLIDRATHDRVVELLTLWERIAQRTRRVEELEQERQKLYQAQQQVQGNMGALSHTGREGELRARYVEQLAATEDQLKALAREEAETKSDIARLNDDVTAKLKALE